MLFLRAIAECFARLTMAWASVCLSVTLLYCIKTVQAKITKSSLLAASKTLIYRDEISCPWVRGFPSNESVKRGTLSKRRYFDAIGSFSVKKLQINTHMMLS